MARLALLMCLFLCCQARSWSQETTPAISTSSAPAVKILTPTQMQQDLAVLRRALIEIHPGLYRYNTPAGIDRRFADAVAAAGRPTTEAVFFRTLAQLVDTIKCGHTYLNPYNQSDALMQRLFGQRTEFPIFFSVIDRHLIVTQNASTQPLPPGSEIMSINGIPASRILDTLLTVTTADGNGTREYRLHSIGLTYGGAEKYHLFDLYFPLFFPITDGQYRVQARDVLGKKISFTVPAMTDPERAAALKARYGDAPRGDALWKYSLLGPDTADLKVGTFVTFHATQDYHTFLADVFARMRAQNVKFLVVDLRGNDGGDEEMGETVASYLAHQPIPCYDDKIRYVRSVSIDADLFPDLDTYDPTLRQRIQVTSAPNQFKKSNDARYEGQGLYECLDRSACMPVQPQADRFQGTVYVLGDASNASAAFQFLRAVQDNKLGTIIGQEGGGDRQGINGDAFFFLSLPNSRIEVDLPTFFESPRTLQPDQPIVPDISVPSSLTAIQQDADPDMNVVNRLIAKARVAFR